MWWDDTKATVELECNLIKWLGSFSGSLSTIPPFSSMGEVRWAAGDSVQSEQCVMKLDMWRGWLNDFWLTSDHSGFLDLVDCVFLSTFKIKQIKKLLPFLHNATPVQATAQLILAAPAWQTSVTRGMPHLAAVSRVGPPPSRIHIDNQLLPNQRDLLHLPQQPSSPTDPPGTHTRMHVHTHTPVSACQMISLCCVSGLAQGWILVRWKLTYQKFSRNFYHSERVSAGHCWSHRIISDWIHNSDSCCHGNYPCENDLRAHIEPNVSPP